MTETQIVLEQHQNEQHLLNVDHLHYTHYLSTENIKEAVEFIWLQMFKEILVTMAKHVSDAQRKIAFHSMLDICRTRYQNDPNALAQIDEFEQTYIPSHSIKWYTKDSFVYRITNEALRTDDVATINKFRFYIGDLCCSLSEHHRQASISHTLHVFRGTTMPYTHLLKLQAGLWIADNAFVSTTRDRTVAEVYSGSPSFGKTTDNVSVVFDITIDYRRSRHRLWNRRKEKRTVIFIDISSMSAISDEDEILFDLGTIFEIVSIVFDEPKLIWTVQLRDVSMDDANHRMQRFVRDSPNEAFEVLVRRTNEWIMTAFPELLFDDLLIKMFEQSNPFDAFLDEAPLEDGNVYHIGRWFGRFLFRFCCMFGRSQLDSLTTFAAYNARIQQEGISRLAPQLNRVTPITAANGMRHWAHNQVFTTTASHSINEHPVENSTGSSILGMLAREIRTYHHESIDN